jgi:hypothetical protein
MKLEHILRSEEKSLADDLRSSFNGLFVDEEYRGRRVQFSRTFAGFIISLTNPDYESRPISDPLKAIRDLKNRLGL